MTKPINTLATKLRFYASYFFYKLIIPFEVRSPRWKFWVYEWKYTAAKFRNYETCLAWSHSIDTISTCFGQFKIRLNTSDAAQVSPAYERLDVNYLLRVIEGLRAQNKRVLFCDIGADLGVYSVVVARTFPTGVTVSAFEPISESCELILENTKLNGVENLVGIFPLALSNEDNPSLKLSVNVLSPASSSMVTPTGVQVKEFVIETKRLDTLMAERTTRYDALVLKIDVEGMEQQVIEGAKQAMAAADETYLVVEDFIYPQIISFLQDNGWQFLAKKTSYNSWWKHQR